MIGNNFFSTVVQGIDNNYELSGKNCNMALCMATLERIIEVNRFEPVDVM